MVILPFDTVGASLRASTIVSVLPCMFVVRIVMYSIALVSLTLHSNYVLSVGGTAFLLALLSTGA